MHPSEFCFPDIPGQETPPAICNKNIWIITGHQPSQRKGIWYTQASRRNNRINSRLLVARWVRVRLRRVLIHYRPLINLPRVDWLTRKCWKLNRASLKCIKVYDVENSVYVVRPVNAVNVINFASLDKKMMYYMENYKKVTQTRDVLSEIMHSKHSARKGRWSEPMHWALKGIFRPITVIWSSETPTTKNMELSTKRNIST